MGFLNKLYRWITRADKVEGIITAGWSTGPVDIVADIRLLNAQALKESIPAADEMTLKEFMESHLIPDEWRETLGLKP